MGLTRVLWLFETPNTQIALGKRRVLQNLLHAGNSANLFGLTNENIMHTELLMIPRSSDVGTKRLLDVMTVRREGAG
jgi:hypothetical protein